MIVVLHETKCEEWDEKLLNYLWKSKPWLWRVIPSVGVVGCVLVQWDSTRVTMVETYEGLFSISLFCRIKGDTEQWLFTGLYENREKNAFLGRIRQCGQSMATSLGFSRGFQCSTEKSREKQPYSLLKLMEEWWLGYTTVGRPGFVLSMKIKNFKARLRLWARENIGRFEARIQKLEEILGKLETKEEVSFLSMEETGEKLETKLKVDEVLKEEDIFWPQRSRVQWLKNGDRYTKLFHRVANSGDATSTVRSLLIVGATCIKLETVKEHVVKFYEDFYSESNINMPFFGNLTLKRLEEHKQD